MPEKCLCESRRRRYPLIIKYNIKNMNMHLSGVIKKYLLALSVLVMFYACTDDKWDEHYAANLNVTSDETLIDKLRKEQTLSDFVQVLDSVKVMNGHKLTSVTYADLMSQQFFTVFAPVNGSFNKDSLLALCVTSKGNEQVAEWFIQSHLSRTPYSFYNNSSVRAKMLNTKYLQFENNALAGVGFVAGKSNMVAKNGIIHIMNGTLPFLMNIYEALTNIPEFEMMGKFLMTYQKDSLDEYSSVSAGINDEGVTVYVDSVMIEKNSLFRSFGYINSEDSSYRMIVPSKAGIENAYAKISKYYNFGSAAKADSLKKFWTNYSMMKDLIFNWNMQRSPQDSLISTQYYYYQPKYHVFYKPFAEKGILSNATTLKTSNGIMYKVDQWPLDMTSVFFIPITVEAEIEKNINTLDKTRFKFNQRQKFSNYISNSGYLDLFPIKNSDKPDITFNIRNTLSGKYDVCVVLLPKTIYDAQTTDFKPNKFSATITYELPNGSNTNVTCRGKEGQSLSFFENKPTAIDTITLSTLTFPVCNYGQEKVKVTLRLQSVITPKEMTKYSQEMFIDCLYLKPRQD
jgi:hypothetical protein